MLDILPIEVWTLILSIDVSGKTAQNLGTSCKLGRDLSRRCFKSRLLYHVKAWAIDVLEGRTEARTNQICAAWPGLRFCLNIVTPNIVQPAARTHLLWMCASEISTGTQQILSDVSSYLRYNNRTNGFGPGVVAIQMIRPGFKGLRNHCVRTKAWEDQYWLVSRLASGFVARFAWYKNSRELALLALVAAECSGDVKDFTRPKLETRCETQDMTFLEKVRLQRDTSVHVAPM